MTNSLRIATYLLWASVAIQGVALFLESPPAQSDPGGFEKLAGIALTLGFMVISGLAAYYFSRGRNWARVTVLVLFVTGILGLLLLLVLGVGLDEDPWLKWLTLGQVLLEAPAMYFAFTSPGADCFKAGPQNDAAMRAILPVGRSGWAIAAGYLALFSILLLPAPFALACGLMAMRAIRRNPAKHGMGRAIFGIVMGTLGTLAFLFVLWVGYTRRTAGV
ncbi:MAG: DUF4190 domain-containing protein [Candidatus Solibacter sp.]